MSGHIVASMIALAACAMMLATGCRARPSAPVGGWYAPPPRLLSCSPKPRDVPCVTCAKAACCAEVRACERDPRCRCLLKCANRPWSFSECTSDARCGEINDLYRDVRACLSARCTMCPTEHGGGTP